MEDWNTPHTTYTELALRKDWKALLKAHSRRLVNCVSRQGLSILEHHQPNFWNVENSKGQSIAKNWNNPELRKEAEERTMKHYTKMYKSEVRRNIAFYSGSPLPTAYRPLLAKSIVDFCNAKKVLDCSIGWGGRMIGTLALEGTTFEGCEPCSATYDGLVNIVSFLGMEDRVKLHKAGAEDVLPTLPSQSYDLMITSPPYYNLEIYSHEESQSIKKFPSWDEWIEKFIEPVVREVLRCLKEDGVSAWSVKNFRKYKLQDIIFQLHKKYGWEHTETFAMTSTPRNKGETSKVGEETFLFKKV